MHVSCFVVLVSLLTVGCMQHLTSLSFIQLLEQVAFHIGLPIDSDSMLIDSSSELCIFLNSLMIIY